MIADESLTIRYMNPAVISLLQDAEQELKRELPRFSVATLIGSNIDVFHKNPQHQRKMLMVMDKSHSATITLGSLTFDLVITPIFQDGTRSGFVVEWYDARPRLLNVDYAAKMVALGRTQAIIEFSTEGVILDANEQFLKAMGYRIDEIRGKHHSMFVEPAFRESPDYKIFWDRLRGGEFQAAQFRRIGKGGRVVWIEGAYNPILDGQGRVCKIVKFAADVTEQAKLLADLKTLIDRNFGEIDHALEQSEAEGVSASGAADATLARVQTVAAGTGQLASSINEIAGNMARTQGAADQAFQRAIAVGDITNRLAAATRQMNGIVDLIRNVAGQINLLALNATIEAARAGEAGKGFAVVASEVKDLANQSASATAQISREIEGMQATSLEVAEATETICEAIKNVREFVTSAASAVEEQNAVTGSISADMQTMADTVATTSHSIHGMSSAFSQVAQAVAKTKQAATVLVR
jgi:PAS domain S-box-containing protein